MRRMRRILAGVLVTAASPAAHAAAELVSLAASPGTTALFGGIEVRDHGVFAEGR